MTTSPRLLGGRYEVGELIGRGGMAEVHVGHDTRLGRSVAIKILRSDLARDTSFLARFRREAQSAAGLNHPAIVAVYDSGDQELAEAGGAPVRVPYIVMEHVEGKTLRDLLNAEQALDPDEAARITAGVLSALEYSHDQGIVHRDIKPANVMVTRGGAVKVMDFGIARALADTAATMTQTQAVLGTARYLSPEQAQGEDVDARSDLYSTGCLLYELLAGRTPFVGDPVSLVYQHLGETAQPPSVHEPGVPPALDAVALHSLVKDRDGRYQHAADFRADLQAARSGLAVSDAAQSTGAGAAAAVGAGAAAGTGAAGAGSAAGATQALPPADPSGMRSEDHDDTAEIPVGERERHRGGYVLLGLLALLALAALGWAAMQVFEPPDDEGPPQTAVPRVIGMSEDEAVAAIAERNLEPEAEYEAHDTEPEGRVFNQEPDVNLEVDEGTVVTFTVSEGPDAIEVPNVEGSTEDSARSTLEGSGLTVAGETEEVDDPEFEAGRVVRTDPEAGEVISPDRAVTLVLASGEVEVPDLTEMTETEASIELDELNLAVGDIEREDSEEPESTVLEQSIAPGEVVEYGTEVNLTVAQSPDETVITTETVTTTPDPPTTEPDPTTTTEPDPTTTEPDPTTTTEPDPTTTEPDPTTTTEPDPTGTSPTQPTDPPTDASAPGNGRGRGPGSGNP